MEINIDNGRICMNGGVDSQFLESKHVVPQAITIADNNFTCEEPKVFGNGCFGSETAFNNLQALLARREAVVEEDNVFSAMPVTELLPC